MIWTGCADWAEFGALAGIGAGEPPDLVAVLAEDRGEGGRSFQAVWRERGLTGVLLHHGGGRAPHVDLMDDEEAFETLVRLGAPRRGDRPDGERAPFADALLAEAAAVGGRIGARVAWRVECMSGDRYEGVTWTVAVYADAALALAHAAAAAMAEEDEADSGDHRDGPPVWSVSPVTVRSALPAALAPYASGRRRPPSRPSLVHGEDGSNAAFGVSVPWGGAAAFSGFGAARAAAAFLCGMPLAKPTGEERSLARECRAEDISAEGTSLRWSWPEAEWAAGGGGEAVFSGPDAAAMAAEAAAAMERASSACRDERRRLEEWRASEEARGE